MLEERDVVHVLSCMQMTDLWGVARRMTQRLQDIGITLPLRLRGADPQFIRERFSVVMQRIVMELRGVQCIALEDHTPDRKGIIASRSFGRQVTTRQEMEEAVASYAARACEKMRRQNLATAHISVFIETNSFKPTDPQYHASRATASRRQRQHVNDRAGGIKSAECVMRNDFRYKKAGVMFLDLGRAAKVQGDLWTTPDTGRSKAPMKAMDALNAHYGRDTLAYAVAGRSKA